MNGRTLIADDDAANRTLMGEILRGGGYQVNMANDGQAALEQFTHTQPDLVLLDFTMPRVRGLKVCSRLKSNPDSRLVPVMLMTGRADAEDRVQGLAVGADAFLVKPFEPRELLAWVHSRLALKSYTAELEPVEDVIFTLSRAVEAKDPYTVGHCERLSAYSVQLGQRIGLPADQITSLKRAGIVHDIGKIAVPDFILLKTGPLNSDEWKIMRGHPVFGAHICGSLKSFRSVCPIIRHHHEKLDGSGYPDGIRGTKLPLTARILQIADIYDALTTKRSYKIARSTHEAFEIMEREVKRGWWDPEVFKEFKHMLADERENQGGT
jgi:cyclic di-GMP phosphodiesterase